MVLEITKTYIERAKTDFDRISGENGSMDVIGNRFYYEASELGILRLAIKYRDSKNTSHKYSENLKSWYFCLEVNL